MTNETFREICISVLIAPMLLLCIVISAEIAQLMYVMALSDCDGRGNPRTEALGSHWTFANDICYENDVEYTGNVTYQGNVYYDGKMPILPQNNPFQDTIDSLIAVIDSLKFTENYIESVWIDCKLVARRHKDGSVTYYADDGDEFTINGDEFEEYLNLVK